MNTVDQLAQDIDRENRHEWAMIVVFDCATEDWTSVSKVLVKWAWDNLLSTMLIDPTIENHKIDPGGMVKISLNQAKQVLVYAFSTNITYGNEVMDQKLSTNLAERFLSLYGWNRFYTNAAFNPKTHELDRESQFMMVRTIIGDRAVITFGEGKCGILWVGDRD